MLRPNAKEFFTRLHDVEVNQKYNKKLPYSFHLEMVHAQALKFKDCLNSNYSVADSLERTLAFEGCYGHDSIEDARLTYNDIKDKFDEKLAEVVFLCTEFRGRNRSERKPDAFYNEMITNRVAVFVKLCDIIANVKFSILTNSSMLNKAKTEWPRQKRFFESFVEYQPMLNYLDSLFALECKG